MDGLCFAKSAHLKLGDDRGMQMIKTIAGPFAKTLWILVGAFLLTITAILDYVTGPDLSFSLFYAIPIAFFAWKLKGNYGILAACFSALTWLYIETRLKDASIFIHLWNGTIRFGFFLMLALFLKGIDRERQHARTDFLTSAVNHRHFHELLQREIDRSIRYNLTFTVAFIDTDNFKVVNDTFGHTFGDSILKGIVEIMQRSLRKTDITARVGGDEFAILLPETDGQSARAAISHMIQTLAEEMHALKCPVTFSIGALTLNAPKLSPSKILSIADRMMYIVKNNGKNNVRYETYQDKMIEVSPETNTAPPTPPQS